jgi:hypothetical protein
MPFSTGEFVLITDGFLEGQKAVVEHEGEDGVQVRLVTDMSVVIEPGRLTPITPETLDDIGHAMNADLETKEF